jgi:hypothetical protein
VEFKGANEAEVQNGAEQQAIEIEELNVSSMLTCVASTMLPTTLMLELEALWIADTGATSHVTKYATGGINRDDTAIKMKGCMNGRMTASFEMDIPVTYCDKGRNKIRSMELKDVPVNNRFNFNLFSVTNMLAKGFKLNGDKKYVQVSDRFNFNLFNVIKMLSKGFKLNGDKKSISIFKEACSFEFNNVIHMKHGALYCAVMKRKLANNYSEVTNASVSDETPVKKILKTSMK